jgi:hypothetical protein
MRKYTECGGAARMIGYQFTGWNYQAGAHHKPHLPGVTCGEPSTIYRSTDFECEWDARQQGCRQ